METSSRGTVRRSSSLLITWRRRTHGRKPISLKTNLALRNTLTTIHKTSMFLSTFLYDRHQDQTYQALCGQLSQAHQAGPGMGRWECHPRFHEKYRRLTLVSSDEGGRSRTAGISKSSLYLGRTALTSVTTPKLAQFCSGRSFRQDLSHIVPQLAF